MQYRNILKNKMQINFYAKNKRKNRVLNKYFYDVREANFDVVLTSEHYCEPDIVKKEITSGLRMAVVTR